MPTKITPQNLIPAVENIMAEMDAVQAKFNKVLLQQAEREAHLLQQLSAVTEKLDACLERLSKCERKLDGRTTAKTVLDAKEAAAYLGLKRVNSIYGKVDKGQIPAVKAPGGRYYFRQSDLAAYRIGEIWNAGKSRK